MNRQKARISVRRFLQLVFGAACAHAVLSGGHADAVPGSSGGEFATVQEGYEWSFPRDHGRHDQYATEWWYVTGHLHAPAGRTFGFELVFFRIGLAPERSSQSAWAASSLHLAHAAITDDRNGGFHFLERRSRGSFGDAAIARESLDVSNGPFVLRQSGDTIALRFEGRSVEAPDPVDLKLELQLRSRKPPALHGERGFSRKGPGDGEASQYYSLTRLEGSGSLRIGKESVPIERASAWLDQEFTSSGLAHGTLGWDWYAIQLDDGRELMLYQLKDAHGKPTQFSSGTLIAVDGTVTRLERDRAVITPLAWWRSPKTGVRYPSKWRIEVPSEGLAMELIPTVADQELVTSGTTGVTYWEGRCRVTAVDGSERGAAAQIGESYVELVGWDRNSASHPEEKRR